VDGWGLSLLGFMIWKLLIRSARTVLSISSLSNTAPMLNTVSTQSMMVVLCRSHPIFLSRVHSAFLIS
jgi:hypothetical protein